MSFFQTVALNLFDEIQQPLSTNNTHQPKNKKRPLPSTTPHNLEKNHFQQLFSDLNLSLTKKPKLENPTNSQDWIDDSAGNIPGGEIINLAQSLNSSAYEIQFQKDRKACQHELCMPPGSDVPLEDEILNSSQAVENPARVYPFELDPFQKVAIACIEHNQSVLVSAHTSAGKTAVAEYAIATCLRNKSRVIYTSPIKALSNQKYRDLCNIFQDVGLMTGDITINPNASCLVMTTEILALMLYRGSELLSELSWVIYDEIHYMRDPERGVVWEETIILLPDAVKFVFLSATIPNAKEFANWIAHIHNQPCHVVYTDFRPTPLEHYLFPYYGKGLHLVVDEKKNFLMDNFEKAIGEIKRPVMMSNMSTLLPSQCGLLVDLLANRGYTPVIFFVFSKKNIENISKQITKKYDFLNESEKELVNLIYKNATDLLSDEDKELPQVKNILSLLRKGIGIHHAGLIPIVKEIVEILFQEGLIHFLFATETFSMGINMPAKTVIFTDIKKCGSNKIFRFLTSGEYIQMSGRAGRRGIDHRGIVILMLYDKILPGEIRNMATGPTDVLYSAFHLTYSMLLNLMLVEGIDPLYVVRKSFRQFQVNSTFPDLEKRLKDLSNNNPTGVSNEIISEFYFLRSQKEKLQSELKTIVFQSYNIRRYLTEGRVVKLRDQSTDWGWGIIVRSIDVKDASYVDVLLNCEELSHAELTQPFLNKSEIRLLTVPYDWVDEITDTIINIPRNLSTSNIRKDVYNSLMKIIKSNIQFPQYLDYTTDLKPSRSDNDFATHASQIHKLESRLKEPQFESIDEEKLKAFTDRVSNEIEKKQIQSTIMATKNIIFYDKLKAMQRILKRLGYVTKDNVVSLKGRVAASLNSTLDELVATELLFNGFFTNLSPQMIAAIMSCFSGNKRAPDETEANSIDQKFLELYAQLMQTVDHVITVSEECNLFSRPSDRKDYKEKFSVCFMPIFYSWADGASFATVVKDDIFHFFEGDLVRNFRLIAECMKQLVNCSKILGNDELENKFTDTLWRLKRGLVSAASLYL